MVEDAEKSGALQPDGTIIEPQRQHRHRPGWWPPSGLPGTVLVMPDSMSVDRRRLMLAYGARFDLTPKERAWGRHRPRRGAQGADARRLDSRNSSTTRRTPTSMRVPQRGDLCFPDGLDVLITGVGTGGHLTGCARVLKSASTLKVFAVEPALSPVISGGQWPPPIRAWARASSQEPGHQPAGRRDPDGRRAGARDTPAAPSGGNLLVGISSGATLAAIAQNCPSCPPAARDAGLQLRHRRERYLSVEGFLPPPRSLMAPGRWRIGTIAHHDRARHTPVRIPQTPSAAPLSAQQRVQSPYQAHQRGRALLSAWRGRAIATYRGRHAREVDAARGSAYRPSGRSWCSTWTRPAMTKSSARPRAAPQRGHHRPRSPI